MLLLNRNIRSKIPMLESKRILVVGGGWGGVGVGRRFRHNFLLCTTAGRWSRGRFTPIFIGYTIKDISSMSANEK